MLHYPKEKVNHVREDVSKKFHHTKIDYLKCVFEFTLNVRDRIE